MRITLTLNNIKCGGCEKSITSKLETIDGISVPAANAAEGKVSFDYENEISLMNAKQTLANMGYTEDDPSFTDTAKSYVSCMIGKMK